MYFQTKTESKNIFRTLFSKTRQPYILRSFCFLNECGDYAAFNFLTYIGEMKILFQALKMHSSHADDCAE